ncbi:MAG: hydrogenase maturation nickel metallochaperone HypA [Bacteroidota bacterium]
MHELSLVRNIFASLEPEFSEEELRRLQTVRIKIGMLANVEPILLQNAFTAYQQEHPKFQAVKLETELVPIKVHCESCGALTTVRQYLFKCDACGLPSRNIVSGEELLIHQVVFDEVMQPDPT